MTNVLALPSGTELVGDYRIERMLGAGGFGITYLAEESALARKVTIKEYFPSDLAVRGEALVVIPRDGEAAVDFQWGLDRFIVEVQALARFEHPNIVKVYRYFRAHDTAYMVLRFEEGQSLKSWLKSLSRHPRQGELDKLVAPLLDALEVIHAGDFLHRDIAPDNIIIRTDGSPVLIDFGSARGDIARHTRTLSALIKPGYSPYEQYAENGERQGPWTDIYALGATLYHAIAGKRPPDAPSRIVKDELVPAREAALAAYRPRFLAAIDRALALDPDRRPQSVAAWRGDLLAPEEPSRSGWLPRRAARKPFTDPLPGTTPLPGAVPPPPDVPAAKGSLLDYLDGLKREAEQPVGQAAQPATADPLAATVVLPRSEPAPSTVPPKATTKPTAQSAPLPPPPAVIVHAKAPKPPRPRPVGRSAGRVWRSFLFKFAIGASIAGAAVAMQDKMPKVDLTRGASIITGALRFDSRLPSIPGHPGGTAALAFSEDGRAILTTGADGTLKVWSASTGSLMRSLDLASGPATSLAVLGNAALTAHGHGAVELWDVSTGERRGIYRRNDASIWSVAFLGRPTRFIAASHDWTATVWDLTAGGELPIAVLEGHTNAVQAVAYSHSGPYIATGSADRTVRLWRSADLTAVRTLKGNREYVTALAFSGDGRYLASGALDGSIRVWNTATGGLQRSTGTGRGRISGLVFSPGGDAIASAAEDGSVQVWPFRQSRGTRKLIEEGPPARGLAFSPDGKRLAVAGADGPVRVLDATPPQKQARGQ